MSTTRLIIEKQGLHLVLLSALLAGIAGPPGYALRFGIGLVQFHVARIQYFLNRIDG